MNVVLRFFNTLKEFLFSILGFAFIILMAVVAIFLLEGTVHVGEKILPFLLTVSNWLLLVFLLLLIPMGFARRTRTMAGSGAFFFSYIFGLTLWFYSAIVTYYLWGMFAIIIGLAFFGVGVMPLAILASIFRGEWGLFWNLVYMIALTYGSRMLGLYFLSRVEQDTYAASYQAAAFSENSHVEVGVQALDAEIVSEQVFCTNCGKEISSESSFCRFCGNKR